MRLVIIYWKQFAHNRSSCQNHLDFFAKCSHVSWTQEKSSCASIVGNIRYKGLFASNERRGHSLKYPSKGNLLLLHGSRENNPLAIAQETCSSFFDMPSSFIILLMEDSSRLFKHYTAASSSSHLSESCSSGELRSPWTANRDEHGLVRSANILPPDISLNGGLFLTTNPDFRYAALIPNMPLENADQRSWLLRLMKGQHLEEEDLHPSFSSQQRQSPGSKSLHMVNE